LQASQQKEHLQLPRVKGKRAKTKGLKGDASHRYRSCGERQAGCACGKAGLS